MNWKQFIFDSLRLVIIIIHIIILMATIAGIIAVFCYAFLISNMAVWIAFVITILSIIIGGFIANGLLIAYDVLFSKCKYKK